MPAITERQLGCQAGNHSEGLPFRHSTPLCFPLLTPVPCCGCCLPWSPSSQPLMPRASCLCSKPSIPAQEQSQGAEPAKGTQLQPRLPSPPSLTQALLCTRKSHRYFLGRAPMTNPTHSRSSRVMALEPSGERPPPSTLRTRQELCYSSSLDHKGEPAEPPENGFLSVELKDAEKRL